MAFSNNENNLWFVSGFIPGQNDDFISSIPNNRSVRLCLLAYMATVNKLSGLLQWDIPHTKVKEI